MYIDVLLLSKSWSMNDRYKNIDLKLLEIIENNKKIYIVKICYKQFYEYIYIYKKSSFIAQTW